MLKIFTLKRGCQVLKVLANLKSRLLCRFKVLPHRQVSRNLSATHVFPALRISYISLLGRGSNKRGFELSGVDCTSKHSFSFQ